MHEGWNFVKSYGTKIINAKTIEKAVHWTIAFLDKHNMTEISKSITKATGIELPFLNDKLIDTISNLEQNGGLKEAAQHELRHCANKAGIEEKNAKEISDCLKKTLKNTESTPSEKMMTFMKCHPITPMEAWEIVGKISNFADCIQSDLSGIQNDLSSEL